MNSNRVVSKVKSFNNKKGFGFLEPLTPGGDDIAIHHSEIERAFEGQFVRLDEGDVVSFVVQRHPKGLRAANARRES